MSKLIILQGPPACGKSTVATKWQAENAKNRVIVSRDALRHARGQYWVPEQEEFITKLEAHMVRKALECGYDVILDATNFNPAYLNRWHQVVQEKGAEIEYWLIHETLETCLERNGYDSREHTVPEDTVKYFYEKYTNWCAEHNIKAAPGTMSKTLFHPY